MPRSIRLAGRISWIIDNWVKNVLDGIFINSKVDDSRIVGLSAMQYTTLENPRIEITIRGITARI